MDIDHQAFEETYQNARSYLLNQRNEHGWWEGRLSGSALSTATSIVALRLYDRARSLFEYQEEISKGINWLIKHQNEDGGWGDTTRSFSNISTTMLCWAALNFAEKDTHKLQHAETQVQQWLKDYAGSTDIPTLVDAIVDRYGKDKTFSVPILTMCALSGRLGPEDQAWRYVMQLPFELAAFPQKWFSKLNLRVVSYALPALIAIGLVRHTKRPSWFLPARGMRNALRERVLERLSTIQPTSGGYLEATPLTSFVSMSLIGAGLHQHEVVERGIRFLHQSMREDGSWPIDTNLATWTTTLSINALGDTQSLDQTQSQILNWLLNQQYREIHPYTNADPGGWAWTDLTGGVPDADDTSGAILALRRFYDSTDDPSLQVKIADAASMGIDWLFGLQNRDGGIPTFCRGWGRLPFDESCADITAHALQAIEAWRDTLPQIERNVLRMRRYLYNVQQHDGTFLPLWFGNQHREDESNPVYGTAKIIEALSTTDHDEDYLQQAVQALLNMQNEKGGWDHQQPSIEETGLALRALSEWLQHNSQSKTGSSSTDLQQQVINAIERGVTHLIELTQRGTHFEPSPIGFYFAKLWYFEDLYPVIWTVGALEHVKSLTAS